MSSSRGTREITGNDGRQPGVQAQRRKSIGNYNLAKCRHVTEKADKIWLETAGLGDLWEVIELEHSLIVRTSFDDE